MDDQTSHHLNEPAEDADQAVLQGLLSGLLGDLPAENREPDNPPALDSSSDLTDFIEGLRFLLDTHKPSVLAPLVADEDPQETPPSNQQEFQDVADGLLAELLENAGTPSPATPPPPATALSLLGLATNFASGGSSFDEDLLELPSSSRPAGPFETLLDAIDSELGPRPDFHPAHAAPEPARGQRFVTFELADDWYALPLERVIETDRTARHTFVPGMPPYFWGVLNIRGEILPLIDLRALFGFDEAPVEGRMLIVEDLTTKQRLAFRVDRLAGIVAIPEEEIAQPLAQDDDLDELDSEDEDAPAPPVASRIAPLLRGVAFPGTQSVHLLDTDRLVAVATGCESLIG